MPASGTSQLQLWLPAVLFAHLFAGAWLLRTYLLCHPGVLQRALQRLQGARRNAPPASADAHVGTVVAVPARVWAERESSGAGLGVQRESSATSTGSGFSAAGHPAAGRRAPQLEWRGVGCSYATDAGVKSVLQDVWGMAEPGEMQAILGPSGSGKTSLLDILAQRKSTGTLSGELLLDGVPLKSWRKSKSRAAYVPQEDNFVPTMTTEETMHFAAAMTLPDSWKGSRRRQRVAEALQIVGLAGQHAVMVGGVLPGGLLLRGLSGGERKRLAVAAGILATPSMLFLDEPTSGLDSFAALSVVGSMRRMAAQAGLVVLASIHQPSARIWALFDRITLLASGCLVYHGSRDGMLEWLGPRGLGFSYEARLHGAPGDWALDIVAVGFPKPYRDFGRTFTTLAELKVAAQRFNTHCAAATAMQAPQAQVLGLADAESGSSCGRASSSQLGTIMEAEATSHAEISSGADASSSGHSSDTDADADGVCMPHAGSTRPFHVHAFGTSTALSAATATNASSATASKGSAGVASKPASRPPVRSIVVVQRQQQQEQRRHQQRVLGRQLSSQRSWLVSGQQGQQQQQQQQHGQQQQQGRARPALHHLRRQYTTLVWREFLTITRNPADAAGRMLTFAWVAILQGIIFWGLPDDASSLRDRLNLLFAILCFFMLMPFISMGLYSADKRFYITDVAARLYNPAVYYAAKVTATLPFSVLAAHIYDATVYGMAGLRHGLQYEVQHGTVAIMVSLVSVQVLHLSAMVAPNQDIAFMLAVTWSAVNLLMSGFLVQFSSMAYAWLGQLRYISAMYYAFEGFARAEFEGRELSCASGVAPDNLDSVLRDALPNTASVQSGMAAAAIKDLGKDCVVDTSAVINFFQLQLGYWAVLGALVLYWWLLHVLTFCAMLWLARRERR